MFSDFIANDYEIVFYPSTFATSTLYLTVTGFYFFLSTATYSKPLLFLNIKGSPSA